MTNAPTTFTLSPRQQIENIQQNGGLCLTSCIDYNRIAKVILFYLLILFHRYSITF